MSATRQDGPRGSVNQTENTYGQHIECDGYCGYSSGFGHARCFDFSLFGEDGNDSHRTCPWVDACMTTLHSEQAEAGISHYSQGQVEAVAMANARYFPFRDRKHLYLSPNDALALLSPEDQDILWLLILAHRYTLHVWEFPWLEAGREHFVFRWYKFNRNIEVRLAPEAKPPSA